MTNTDRLLADIRSFVRRSWWTSYPSAVSLLEAAAREIERLRKEKCT